LCLHGVPLPNHTTHSPRERKLREKDYDKVATHVEIRKFIDELMTKPSHYKRIKSEQFIVDGLAKPLKGYKDRNRVTLRKVAGKPDSSKRKEAIRKC